MKHINITNWQGNITDWTKFNYIYGGLADTIADRVNLRIPGTNLRNYFRKSNNLINASNQSATVNNITYSIKNGVVTLNGTATGTVFIIVNQTIKNGTYTWALFNPTTQYDPDLSPLDDNLRVELRSGVSGVITSSQVFFDSANKTKTFSLSREADSIYIRISGGTVLSNFKFSLMLVNGSTVPTVYEPYNSLVMVENVANVDLGTLTYNYDTNLVFRTYSLQSVLATNGVTYCALYRRTNQNLAVATNMCMSVYSNTKIPFFHNDSYTDITTFKNAMSGVYMIYELATPKITVFGVYTITKDNFDSVGVTGGRNLARAVFLTPGVEMKTAPLLSSSTLGITITSTDGDYWAPDNSLSFLSTYPRISYVNSKMTSEENAKAICPFTIIYELS